MIKRLLAFILFSACALAQSTTTITGNLKNLGTGTVSSNSFVRFYLRGCSGNIPRINGTAIIAPTQGNVYYFDFVPNGSGAISGTLYSTRDAAGTGNGAIECGGSFTAVWYGMTPFLNGKAGPEVPVHAKASATLDISNVTAISTTPVVTAPTGDSTYARIDAGNQPFTGGISATTIQGRVECDKSTGADFSVKMTNCITTAAAGGMIADGSAGFTGTQTVSQNITLRSGVRVLLPCNAIIPMGSFFFDGTAASLNDAPLIGCGYSSNQANGTVGTIIQYTGSVAPIQYGNTTTSAYGIEIYGVGIDISNAANSASCVSFLPTVGFYIHGFTCQAKTTTVAAGNAQEGITLNGGTGAAGAPFVGTGRISEGYITGAKYCVHALATDNSIARVNNIQVDASFSCRVNNAGGDTRQGIYIQNGNTWHLNNPDVDSPDVALHLGANASTAWGGVRPESSATWDILADNGSQDNRVTSMNQNYLTVKVSDSGARNVFYTNEFRFNGVVGGGYAAGGLEVNMRDAQTRQSWRCGQAADQECDWDLRTGNTAAIAYTLGKDNASAFFIRTGGGNNVFKADATNTTVNPPAAAGTLFLNLNNGTNGLRMDDGLGTGTQAFTIGGNANNPGVVNTYAKLTTADLGLTPVVGTPVHLTGQTANLGATNLFAAPVTGMYKVWVQARTTTSGTGTTATFTLSWADEGGAKSFTSSTWALNSVAFAGTVSANFPLHINSGTAVTVSVTGTFGTSVYAIDAWLEREK